MKFQRRAASVALCLLAASSLCAVSASGKSQSASGSHHHNDHKQSASKHAAPRQSAHAKRLAAQQGATHAKKHAALAKQNALHAKQSALHAKRLAAKQKAAWRAHIAKVRELSPKERRALRQHNQRLAKQQALDERHAAALAQHTHRAAILTAHTHRAATLAAHNKRTAMLAAHQQRLAAKRAEARAANTPHARRLAAKLAASARLAAKQATATHLAAMAHNAAIARKLASRRQAAALAAQSHKLAARQTLHERRVAARQAAEDRQARAGAAREGRLAVYQTSSKPRVILAHAARPAAQTAHDRRLAAAQAEHDRRLAAARAEHDRRLSATLAEHNRRLAARQAAYQNKMAARNAKIAKAQALHQERLTQHNAHAAASRSHYVATHGDDTGGRSIKFWQTNVANVPVKVITVDLNDPNVKVSAVMARNGDGTSEPFKQMINRANPNVAVTGTFFSLDNLKPVGDIVIDGSLVHFGGMGTALCVTANNKANMVGCEWGRHHDWSAYDFVCACGPRLLQNNRIVLDPRAERFRDKHMLAPNSRIAVGITSGNKLVFAMTRETIYLGRLARVMRGLGCSEAMNLDAGTSTGFYYNGTTLARPGRKLTNMIVVYGRKDRYERALDQLVPPPYRRTSRNAARRPSVLARN